MFGLMKPPFPNLDYSSVYSRCCQMQRRAYGIVSLPFLNHDAVFLYICSLDAGLIPDCVIKSQTCCRLRSDRELFSAPDAAAGRFSGAVSILLADTKLQDDIRDAQNVLSYFCRFVLRRSVRRAIEFMSDLRPGFAVLLNEWSRSQLAIEAREEKITLHEFVRPTSYAVATVAVMMPGVSHRPDLAEFFWSIGENLGAATVAVDCALDWKDDLTTASYNPVTDDNDAVKAAILGLEHLRVIMELCEKMFGRSSRSAYVSRQAYCATAKRLQSRCSIDVADIGDIACCDEIPSIPDEDGKQSWCNGIAERIGVCIRKYGCSLRFHSPCSLSQRVPDAHDSPCFQGLPFDDALLNGRYRA